MLLELLEDVWQILNNQFGLARVLFLRSWTALNQILDYDLDFANSLELKSSKKFRKGRLSIFLTWKILRKEG